MQNAVLAEDWSVVLLEVFAWTWWNLLSRFIIIFILEFALCLLWFWINLWRRPVEMGSRNGWVLDRTVDEASWVLSWADVNACLSFDKVVLPYELVVAPFDGALWTSVDLLLGGGNIVLTWTDLLTIVSQSLHPRNQDVFDSNRAVGVQKPFSLIEVKDRSEVPRRNRGDIVGFRHRVISWSCEESALLSAAQLRIAVSSLEAMRAFFKAAD